MRDACLRAIELGLPAVTFTDHADLTALVVSDAAAEYIRAVGGHVDGNLYRPPPLDVDGGCQATARPLPGRQVAASQPARLAFGIRR